MIRLIKLIINLGSILILCVGMLYVYARYIEPNLLVTVYEEIEVNSLIKDLKVVLFADTHFGSLYGEDHMEHIVDTINKVEADFVIFAGDFFDSYQEDQALINIEYIKEQLNGIEAKEGKIAIWGNHDKGGSYKVYEEVMEDGGFLLLTNEDFIVDEYNLCIRGLDDYLLGSPNFNTDTLEEDRYNLVVLHEPDASDEMDLSKIDLLLAGHSHGGQVYIPKITEQFLPKGAKKYRKGIYELDSIRGTYLYVTKGIGLTQLPYRFMNIPEIVVLDLKVL
ncbi:MAG: metallophosphoesterase [Eubacteriales bacterium]